MTVLDSTGGPGPQDSAGARETVLHVEGLSVGYRTRGEVRAVVSEVGFSIGKGEAYGLVGESGCGKTTVAMTVMRYLPRNAVVAAGTIAFKGADLLGAKPAQLRAWRGNQIAMVYQDPASSLNPTMRVGHQVAEVYRYHGGLSTAEALDAAAAMLAKVQITDIARVMRRYPHELSGGQQQRVMIAMALATGPDLLVLDEPTTGLDATVEAEVLDLVEDLRVSAGAAILFISHNLGIVSRLCDRVGVLYGGHLVEEGGAAELFGDPRHPYTLGLLRCVPRFGMRKDRDRLSPIEGYLPAPGSIARGCVFAPRCPIATQECRDDEPPLVTIARGHTTLCFHPDQVAGIPPVASPVPPGGGEATPGGHRPVLLDVEDLVKTYVSGGTGVQAVAGVSFRIGKGETFGLVGESGSGKTSLARTIIGLVEQTEGRVSLDATELPRKQRRRTTSQRRAIQIVFQNPDSALNPRHRVRRILARAMMRLSGTTRTAREARVRDLARSVRLEDRHLDARPAELSGGLQQRVAIARAFAGSPQLVLCDEPVSALDVSVQAAILNLLVDLQASKGVSYLLISHDLGVVRYLADTIGVMYLGQLVESGPAEAVFEPPHHPYTEALCSAIPAIDRPPERRRIRLEGVMPSPAEPPTGCRFHTRCPRFLGDICREVEPPWQEGPGGNRYRCHIGPAELATQQESRRDEGAGRTARQDL